jgi:GNAT superfamily N-acetyltransferase
MARANIDCGFHPSKERPHESFACLLSVRTEASPARVEGCGPDDVEALIPLMREFYAGERLPWDESALRRALATLWSEPQHGTVWLARAGDDPVGYGVLCCGFSLEYGGRDAFVDELFVQPRWRGRGIGGNLLGAMEESCRSRGMAALHLEVDHDNPDGRRLYLRRGFTDHPRHLMTKWLTL